MKIYVVTAGIYSDYHIERVFTDRKKAEEYKLWLRDSNDVEEYDTSDDIFIQKKYYVSAELRLYPNRPEELSVSAFRDSDASSNYQSYMDYGCGETIHVVRVVNADNYDEQYWKDKVTKVVYDLKAYIAYLKMMGFTEKQIRDEIRNHDES